MSIQGWIKLHRQLQDCWIWQEKESFDMRSAWIDLLLTANHSDKKILFNGELVTVKRGQILTSVRKLSEKWNWSVNKVYRFLKLLISDEMLQKESDNNRTLLTIIKYEVYQLCEYTNEHIDGYTIGNSVGYTNDTPSETVSDTPSEHKQECKELNNVKNEKNDKKVKEKDSKASEKKTIQFVPPTVQEVDDYCFERNNGINAESFIDFYESKGWMIGKNKMKDWKAAVRTWEKSERKPQQARSDKIANRVKEVENWI